MYALILLPEWDCKTCTGVQKVSRGCEDTPKQEIQFNDTLLDRCPRRPLLDNGNEINLVFWLYRNYDRGILPEEGGLLSQPHRLAQFFEVIDLSKAVANDEQQKREQQRAQNRARLQTKTG